jgi:hypothetical protein
MRPAAGTPTFDELEAKVLARASVADARLAQRTGLSPSEADLDTATMSVIIGDNQDAIVIDGKLDPFSFDARKKMIESAKDLSRALPDEATTGLERMLVGRLLDEELARVQEERALPESASTLVDAMTSTLPDGGDMAKRDKWMARRLDAITEAYRAHPLREVQRAELDDALDPLEKKTAGYPDTIVALSRLRDALEAVRSSALPSPASDSVHLYSTFIDARPTTMQALDADAARIVGQLTAEIRKRESTLSDAVVRRIEGDAGKKLVERGACRFDAEAGRVRRMPSSREREDACRLVRLVADADPKNEEQVLITLLVVRDRANMARWITADASARPSHPFQSTISMPDARKLERGTVAHPAAALAAMKAVDLLEPGAPSASFADEKQRALAWQKVGDAPYDVVADRLK